jgi:hypothetical protein
VFIVLIVEVFIALKCVIAFSDILSPIDLAVALFLLLTYISYREQ